MAYEQVRDESGDEEEGEEDVGTSAAEGQRDEDASLMSQESAEWTTAEITSGSSTSPASAVSGRQRLLLRSSLLVLLSVALLLLSVDVLGGGGRASSSMLRQLLPSGSFSLLSHTQPEGGAVDEDPSPPLSPGEREMVSILTGAGEVSTLPSSLLRVLREALQRLAVTVLVLRPSIQRELWASNCRSHTPCPTPHSNLRRGATGPIPDEVVRQSLNDRPAFLSAVMDEWFRTPDPEALFHTNQPPTPPHTTNLTSSSSSSSPSLSNSPSSDSSSSSPSAGTAAEAAVPDSLSTLHFAPGELSEDQALSQRFQRELYARQHPVNCSAEKWLIMDFYHAGGGFGSWNHARSIPMALAIRSGRVLIEAPQYHQWAYSIAWNDCVKVKGMGGCDIFLAASSCTLPDNWRDTALIEQAMHGTGRPAFTGTGVDAQLEWFAERRFLMYTEISGLAGEKWELHHRMAKEWDAESLYRNLPPRLHPYRLMPECWWMRQILAYHQRLTRYGIIRLLPLLTRTLQLPEPNVTSTIVLRFADQRALSVDHPSHWWLTIQALKLTWQMQHIAPGLAQALRQRLLPPHQLDPAVRGAPSPWAAEAAAFLSNPHTRVPLLGYTFVRHGDKGAETGLMPEHEYLRVAALLAGQLGLRQWYVGADSMFSSDAIRALNLAAPKPLHLYSSVQTDETQDKQLTPFAAGFDKDLSFSKPDADKEPIVWNTLIHHAMAQVSDVFLSSWSSNHVRFSYEVATALSEARALAPFVALDWYKYLIQKEGCPQ